MEQPEPQLGVAALADRPVDARKAALVMGLVALLLGVTTLVAGLLLPRTQPTFGTTSSSGCCGGGSGGRAKPRSRAVEAVAATPASMSRAAAHPPQGALRLRRHLGVPLALLVSIMGLGSIKRAFGFERSVGVAMLAWSGLSLGAWLAMRSSSLGDLGFLGRGALAGLVGSVVAVPLASRVGAGPHRLRKSAAAVGWVAASGALLGVTWIGFALGPWRLALLEAELALVGLGAGAASLAISGLALLVSAARRETAKP
jgi:hypothetical protein